MKKLNVIIVATAMTILLLPAIKAQQVVATSGGTGQSTSGTITYTLGELVIDTYNGTDKKLTQGFQQSRLIITAVSELPELGYTINAFPNPTTNYLKLKLEKDYPENIGYSLMDINGKVLLNGEVYNGETNISFESLATGTYFIKIFQDRKEVKTIKVVKQ